MQGTGPELRPSTSWINALPTAVYHKNVFLEGTGSVAFVKTQPHWHTLEWFEDYLLN